jgi:hypothetical protein
VCNNTLCPKSIGKNSNAYISNTDYPIFIIFGSRELDECENMFAKSQVIW